MQFSEGTQQKFQTNLEEFSKESLKHVSKQIEVFKGISKEKPGNVENALQLFHENFLGIFPVKRQEIDPKMISERIPERISEENPGRSLENKF